MLLYITSYGCYLQPGAYLNQQLWFQMNKWMACKLKVKDDLDSVKIGYEPNLYYKNYVGQWVNVLVTMLTELGRTKVGGC